MLQKSTILGIFCSLCLSLNLIGQNTFHVDCSAPAGGNGSSWATAYNDLQIPLGLATSGDLIVVAQGFYSPSTTDATLSFELVDGVQLLGGYLNTDNNLSQRDPINNVTVLTGSLGADCAGAGGSGNAFSVIYSQNVSAATLLDGFTITEGQASAACSGNLRERHGGGWYNNGSGTGNVSSPTVKNCIFIGNTSNCGGGAIFNDGNFFGIANPSFEKCTFESNGGGFAGGALYNNGNMGNASPQFTNCKFIANGANLTPVAYGGACYNLGKNGNSSPIYLNCIFSENQSYAGGAIYNLGETGNANPQIINCTFYGNYAEANGGAIYANAASPGGGNANPYISNSIFFGNTAAPFLGDIFRNNYGTFTVKNCLFDVAANCLELNSGPGPDVICSGFNLFSEDPLFTNEASGDLSLSNNSPAINFGLNTEIGGITQDADCNPRLQQGVVDLGALESPFIPAPAPIELINFSATLNGGQVDLEWTTLSETNNDYFLIERSSDGLTFENIEKQRGAGFSFQPIIYTTIDRNPNPGFNYYRLVQVDFDGVETRSPIQVVAFSDLVIEVFPNPTFKDLSLSISKSSRGELSYEIISIQGQLKATGTLEVNKNKTTVKIPEVESLVPGIYMVRVFDQGWKQQVVRFNKMK